ncbi:nucleoporin Nup85-like protein [Phascolomyces articulosus]|uniref:Nuclear pore complex protein Nup85 n=1 Tax=Phascolomyces articulosus TaxID=60185 RepID=A0AAD5JQL3_9FUNG|nr:nucleoporin Nup85-like protein [Phascolomyces articulosus]
MSFNNPSYYNAYKCIEQIPLDPIAKHRDEMFERSAELFKSIHQSVQQPLNTTDKCKTRSKSELAKISSNYRKLVQDYLLPSTNNKSFTEILERKGAVTLLNQGHYRQLLALWDLCDILYFTDGDERMTGVKLLQWLNNIDKGIHRYDIQGIMNNPKGPIDHHDFWPCIYKLIFRRDFNLLIQLLKMSKNKPPTSKEASQLLDHLLRATIDVPSIPNNPDQDAMYKYMLDWTKWREKVYRMAESLQKTDRVASVMMHQKSLLNALAILHGQSKPIINQADHAAEAIVSIVVNTKPFATPDEIRSIVSELDLSLKRQQQHHDDRFYSYAMLIQGSIAEGLEFFKPDDWWTLVHLVDLFGLTADSNSISSLSSSGYIATIDVQLFGGPDDNQRYSIHFRTFLILVYVRLLSQQSNLWQYGLDYISTCGVLGQMALMNYIQSMPNKNTVGTERLLNYCMEHGYVKEVTEFYKCQAKRGIKDSYSKAIHYLYSVGEYSLLEEICELAIYHFAHSGELTDIGDIETQIQSYCEPLPRIAFYIEFFKLHNLYKQQNYGEAAEVLYDLLMSSDTNNSKFTPFLFIEGFTMLDDRFAQYSENQIMSVLYMLHDMFNQDRLDGLDLVASYFTRIKIFDIEKIDSQYYQDVVKKLFREHVELVANRYIHYKQLILNSNTSQQQSLLFYQQQP